ncbi:LuxR family transcriptional regulator [Streptomyces sp. PT12]|uniref:helix-turn-helix transcriptional regulator n=1 Tax=Streptomyces sp. PT12 TaxID=1510197 RepID=UPI000DE2E70A|nr:LuxR family transcriptional regulator [Streptomyces sp. PT12]RBM11109.1 hypothetical protein DEH69_22225 [Streptomyces sp. PT12]
MELVERTKEMRSLDQFLGEAGAGSGRVVLISGPVATGKTELSVAFSRKVAESGARVINAFGSAEERDIPLAVLRQLSVDITRDEAADPYRLTRAISGQLLDAAGGLPLLVVIDDVHFIDSASLHGVLQLIRRIRTERVMLLMTHADHPTPTVPALHAELLRNPHCHRMTLAPLSADGVAQLLARDVDAERAARWAGDWHALTGGNPLLLRAFRQESLGAGESGSLTARPVAGETFTDVALACLHRSGATALDVARGIAVLGHDVTADLLARLLGADLVELHRAVRILNSGGFLQSLRFRHPAVRAAVLKDPAFDRLPAWHYAAAELLEAEGGAPDRVAEHLVAADRADAPWGISVLLDVAGEALRRNDGKFALRCLELAHSQSPPGPERTEIIGMLVRAEWQVSPARAHTYLAELLDIWREQGLPDREALTVVKAQLWYGRTAEAIEVLKGTGEFPVDGDAATDLAGLRSWVRASYPDLFRDIESLFERRLSHGADVSVIGEPAPPALSVPPVSPAPSGPAPGSAPADASKGASERALVRHAESVLRNYRMGDWWMAAPSAAILDLVYADQPMRAERWCSRLLQEAESRGMRGWRGLIHAIRGEIARRGGRILQAEESSRAAFDQVPPRSWGVMVGLPLANLIGAATARGAPEEAEAHLERSVPEAMFGTRFGLHYLEAQGHHNLAVGRPQAALRHFLICGRRMAGWDMDAPVLIPWRTGVAEALLRLGDRAGALRHLDEQLERPTGYHPRVRAAALRVRAAAVEPRRRVSLLREATELQRDWRHDFELLRALADLSCAYQHIGEQHLARTTARRAWHLAERCRAEPLARRLLPSYATGQAPPQRDDADGPSGRREEHRRERPGEPGASADVGQDGAREGGSDAVLSAAELRVAELASLGHTNRQIAGKLYITVSTVEQHLTRVYRKLSVSRRADLPDRLGVRRCEA